MKTIIWLADDDVRYEETKPLAINFSKIITTIESRHKQRLKLGLPSYHSQFYANTSLYRNMHLKKKYDAVFIGQKYGNRGEHVAYLREHGIDVKVFGPYWESSSRLSQMEMITTINQAKIMLNFSSSPKDPTQKFIKGRVFEVLACGTFLLSEECNDMTKYLKIGKELETFNNKEEMLKKVKFYLSNEKKRETIAQQGETKARSQYSYTKEFGKILEL